MSDVKTPMLSAIMKMHSEMAYAARLLEEEKLANNFWHVANVAKTKHIAGFLRANIRPLRSEVHGARMRAIIELIETLPGISDIKEERSTYNSSYAHFSVHYHGVMVACCFSVSAASAMPGSLQIAFEDDKKGHYYTATSLPSLKKTLETVLKRITDE